MKLRIDLLFLLFSFFFFALIGKPAYAQEKSDSLLVSKKDSLVVLTGPINSSDSLSKEFAPTLDELIKKGRRFTLQSNEIKLELEKTLDTLTLEREIWELRGIVDALEERKNISNPNFNFRYVNALDRILEKALEESLELDEIIQSKLDRLYFQDSLLSNIRNDNFFKYKIRDSLLLPDYSQEISSLKKNIQSIDSAIFYQELQAARFQSQISNINIKIRELQNYVSKSKRKLEKNLLSKEINFLWEDYSIASPKSILSITLESLDLNWTLFKQQVFAYRYSALIAILVIIGMVYYVKSLLAELKKEETDSKNHMMLGKLFFLKKSPTVGVILGLSPILIFLFDLTSITFVTFIIFLQVILCTWVILKSYSRQLVKKWLVIVLVFVFFTLSNLYWEIAYQERMYFLIGSLLVIYLLAWAKEKFNSDNSSEAKLLISLRVFTIVLLGISVLANLLGRFSLAKILSVAGVSAFAHAITLYFFVKILTEIIYLLIESHKKSDSITAFLNFREIQKRLRNILVIFALVLWGTVLLQNLALNEYFIDSIIEVLSKERMLGDTSFTYGSLLLFAGLLYLSSILSTNIAYFISLKDQSATDTTSKKLGSTVLIIRLIILTVGFFVAATAAKISLDKITLVLGALSVGIGFGLQTIINNLVSGLILAFEKPIQIGDDIEVGPSTGKVKEIGIRASKIQAYDGSEIVVPNGDLLSQRLINWTLSDRRRRVELLIGVAYDSDMQKVRELIQKALEKDSIMKYPEPKVYMQAFGDSSVDFRVLFWVDTMDIHLEMRNEVMMSIFDSFHENGIEIPFPKRDIYLKNLPERFGNQEPENKKSPED
ncbi:mechanosensitive ion channel family protein [Algoriphagus mannitolivorans]|uniref:mechanosensitive ion channel family protein n=1 Tax=Algoriphagus mannitolivorans TaxID=226504 RepID=UPI0003FA472D|nr:mechanosensitive ion channel domain-containing protein [Algoriphagus mannitolivorans]